MRNSTNKAYTGKVKIDYRKNRTMRLRFNNVHEDQLEVILLALEGAREVTPTKFDAVLLTNICMYFLATFPNNAPFLGQQND